MKAHRQADLSGRGSEDKSLSAPCEAPEQSPRLLCWFHNEAFRPWQVRELHLDGCRCAPWVCAVPGAVCAAARNALRLKTGRDPAAISNRGSACRPDARRKRASTAFRKTTDDEVVLRLTEPITRYFERRRDLHNENMSRS